MLWTASMLKGYVVLGIDGDHGTVSDLLFDDASWRMRWLVVSTGEWFPNHKVPCLCPSWDVPTPRDANFA
jgi:hypothetical protein